MYTFETKIGTCGIAWNEKGITRVELCVRKKKSSKARPPAWVKEAAKRIANHLAGKPDPFDGIDIDLSNTTPFAHKVYDALRRIPEGITLTYADLARLVGKPGAARAVGRAMATNPVPIIVPCHRVVGAGGKLGGFSAPGGTKTKQKILEIESSH